MTKRFLIAFIIAVFVSLPCFAEEINSSYILMEGDTRQVIDGENMDARLPMASTTKIMTAIVALENAQLGDIYAVSQNAQCQEGTSLYLREGDRISVGNLLYGLMLNSGNDAAVTLAEGISGSTVEFAVLMNKKARELGCRNTNFTNPNGLPEEGHYSSAYDMALIMSYALKNETLASIMSTKRYNIEENGTITYLKNHNKLLWQYEYCTGGKTGFTKEAGRCLVSSAEKDGIRLVAVTLNCPDDWQEHKSLFEYGFEAVNKVKAIKKGDILTATNLNGTRVNLLAAEGAEIPLVNGKRAKLEGKIYLNDNINDVQIGDVLGSAEISFDNFPIARIDVKSGQKVKKSRFFEFGFIRKLIFGREKRTQPETVIDFELSVRGI